MKLNAKALGLTLGIIWGACVFIMTIISIPTGYGGLVLAGVKSVYPGYTIGVGGAFVGLILGFIDGFICGYLIAFVYNKLAK